MTLHEIHGSLWKLSFISVPSSCKLFFFLLDFDTLETKNLLMGQLYFLKSFHFCKKTSIFWRNCLQTRLVYNFSLPIWNKIHHRHSSKIPDSNFRVAYLSSVRHIFSRRNQKGILISKFSLKINYLFKAIKFTVSQQFVQSNAYLQK